MRTHNTGNQNLICIAGILLFLGSMGASFAQEKHALSVFSTTSVSKFGYEVSGREPGTEAQTGFGVGYSFYLNEKWSLGTGMEYQTFEGNLKMNLHDTYESIDIEGEAYEFRYSTTDYKEHQKAGYLNVPLTVQYETRGNLRFFIAAGAKIGFVLHSEFQAEIGSLVTSGYYPQYNVELHDPAFAGFGEFSKVKIDDSALELNTRYSAVFETGAKLLLPSERNLYVGLFLDYGLNDISEKSQGSVVEYQSDMPTAFTGTSLLSAVQKTDGSFLAGKVRPWALGLKVRYALGL